jgi:hypothetical protein
MAHLFYKAKFIPDFIMYLSDMSLRHMGECSTGPTFLTSALDDLSSLDPLEHINCHILQVAMACTIQSNHDDSTEKSMYNRVITDKVMCSVFLLSS